MPRQRSILIGLLASMLVAGAAWADGTTSSSSQSTASYNKINARDPVATAFRLPSGTTLNAKQERAYAKLKAKYESTLREAIDLLHSNAPAEKNKGLKLNRDTRAQIKKEIKELLTTGTRTPNRPSRTPVGPVSRNPTVAASRIPMATVRRILTALDLPGLPSARACAADGKTSPGKGETSGVPWTLALYARKLRGVGCHRTK